MTPVAASKRPARPFDLVYNVVKRRILLNELQPEAVVTELGLANEIGCSQGTVREALLRLQEEGLVTRSGRRGTVVTRLNPDEAHEMMALRRRLELKGAPRAVRAVTESALAEISALNREMYFAAEAGDEYQLIEADKAFHMAIFRLSGLDALAPILARCILHSHRCKLYAPRHRRSLIDTAARHDVLLDRLTARDGPGLGRAIGIHIDTIVSDGRQARAA
jgi:DNA-binding GntR family transcriptional regulator